MQVNTTFPTDLLSVHAIMLAVLAPSCRHSVSFLVEAAHLQAGEALAKCLLGKAKQKH